MKILEPAGSRLCGSWLGLEFDHPESLPEGMGYWGTEGDGQREVIGKVLDRDFCMLCQSVCWGLRMPFSSPKNAK